MSVTIEGVVFPSEVASLLAWFSIFGCLVFVVVTSMFEWVQAWMYCTKERDMVDVTTEMARSESSRHQFRGELSRGVCQYRSPSPTKGAVCGGRLECRRRDQNADGRRLGVSHKQSLVDGKDVLEYPSSGNLRTERTPWTSHEPRQAKPSERRCCHPRKAIRGTFTRIINEINGEFEKSQIDKNDIYSKFNRLESYYTKLVDLNEKYQALLVVKEGITEESIDREWQDCDKYEEEKFDIQQKVSILRNPDKEETIPIASEDTVINVKLPELALKTYDGSLEGWLPWWAQFSKIHENKNLSDSDRFLYLRQAIVPNSEAYRVVASYPVTGANYVLAVQALQERFGDLNILTELHPSSGYGMELAKREESDKGVGGAQERLRLLLDFLKAEVRSAQRLKFVEKGFKQEEPYKRSYNDGTRTRSNVRPATVSSLFGGRTNIKCFFCERTNHASHQCRSIMKMSPGERNDKIRSAHLCFKCLRKGHIQSQCREQLECKNCGRNHLEVLCEGNSSNRLTKPGRENLKENAPEPIASLSSQACTGQVLLMTTVALLRGPNASRRVRILLDSGSNKIGEEKHGKFMLELENLGNKRDVIHIEALDKRKICDAIPPLPKGDWLEKLKIKGIILSQDNFKGQEVDILIGANYLGMISTGKIVQVEADLTAVKTKLGWTLMGNSPIIDSNDNVQQTLNLLTMRCDLKDLWDLEVLGIRDPVETCSKETRYQEIKEKFITKIQRQSDQRYSVGLPWKVEKESIPSNLDIAIKRLDISTKKMTSQNKLTEYSQIFRDWLTEVLIERVEENPLERRGYYLPHRPVYKMESKTTPIRPVFDASCLGHNGLSLNQCLEKGTNLLERIPEMMIRFRENKFVVTADIRKAFQMVAIEESERNYLRFLWWEKESDRELIAYRHKKLVFGLNCSPFVLNAVIEYHLQSIRGPLVQWAKILAQSFYMDNCITSLETKQEVQEFQKAAIEIMDRAKMDLREWEYSLEENPEKGLVQKYWRIFDPLGFCAPVFLPPKLLLQRSWGLKLGWDTPLPESMAQEFRTWLDQIKFIELIKIPRYMWNDLIFLTEVHIFCDASQIGYGAVAYLRSETGRENTLTLIWSKVRLAPMKSITIPRLELMAMVLGARLANAIQAALKRKCETTLWSDSTTALSWIKREIEWRVFVRNRVREIQATTNLNDWRFVPSQLNPADLLSRGCPPSQFVQSRWWEGPEWLKKPKEFWPNSEFSINPKEIKVEENIMKTNINLNIDYKDWILTRRSNYSLNIRVMSYVLRFLGKIKKQSTETGPLIVSELDLAEKKLIRMIQEKVSIEKSNATKSFKILKNTDGLWCVESKLLHGQVPEEFKTPIILPGDHPFVEHLIWEVHLKNGHCIACKRLKEKSLQRPMAALPENRIGLGKPFQITGVYLLGPLYLKEGGKVWVAAFTCVVYRAIHLELVKSLETGVFMMALHRFICRRGHPEKIYSDNGTNFAKLNRIFKRLDWTRIERETSIKRIQWIFIPPSAPWWGGFWERMVRTIKEMLIKMLGHRKLKYVQLQTALCEIESIINNRPLTYVSEDDNDLKPLTPNEFLKNGPESSFPEFENLKPEMLHTRYRELGQLKRELKQRFLKEYLGALIQKSENIDRRQLKVGDVVLIGQKNLKRMFWPKGRIVNLIPGKDGIVRVAHVKTSTGTLIRALQRLHPLEISSNVETIQKDNSNTEPQSEAFLGNRPNIESRDSRNRYGRVIRKPARYADKTDHQKSIAGIETAIKGLDHQTIAKIRNITSSALTETTNFPKINPKNKIIAKNLRNRKEILITRSDKGGQTVILETAEYINKMNNILTDQNTFKLISKNDKESICNQYKKYLRSLQRNNTITAEELKDFLSNINSDAYIYGLPKLHKPGNPLRPIVAYYLSPAAPLAKFIANLLIPLLKDNPPKTTITSTPKFISEILDTPYRPNHSMVQRWFVVVGFIRVRQLQKPIVTLAQLEMENEELRQRYCDTMLAASHSTMMTLYQDLIKFITLRSEQIKALLAEVENLSGTLESFAELDEVMEANKPQTACHSTQTSPVPSCKETSSQTDPTKHATPAPASIPAKKPASTFPVPAPTKRKQPEAPNPPAKRTNLKGLTKLAPSRVSKPPAAQVVLHREISAAHTVVISDDPQVDPREILKAVRAAHPLPQGVWTSLRTKGKLVLHSSNPETIPEVSTSLARKLNGMKVRQQKEILPRICLFKVDEETSNSTIEETFLETAAVRKLPGDKVVRVAHRSAPRNGTCTAFIEVYIKTFRALGVRGRIVVDGVILNFEESIRARVCFRCCGLGHNSAQCTRAPKCFHCSEDGYEGRACPSIADQRTYKCANCCAKGLPDKHEARASSCRILKSRALKF
ncbi:hypothetical protein LAZ67_15001635 [Cordylochernes scorpioides]|uniref:Pro-Pol polyprotein n=1 Tax=Cordylochernes scorpioides TaxID=51811 RepID=A0ABY6LAX3_9ARAC|nr:hypothetical protein LAZ67_15001635 [Cordylochernes scorpioides]